MSIFTRRRTLPDDQPADYDMTGIPECTHVLEWLPGWLLEPAGDGFWELQTFADYVAGTPQDTYGFINDPECGATPDFLAEWAAGQLGQPIALTADSQTIRKLTFLAVLAHDCPLYYVSVADGVPA